MKKIVYLTLAATSFMAYASMPEHTSNPFEAHPAGSPFNEPTAHPLEIHTNMVEHPSVPEHPVTLSGDDHNEHSIMPASESTAVHTEQPTKDKTTDTEKDSEKPAARTSTAMHNASLSTINITAGHTHNFDPLTKSDTDVTGYFIKDPEYTQYLTYKETKEGDKTLLRYSLTIPRNA